MRRQLVALVVLATRVRAFYAPVPPRRIRAGSALVVRAQETDVAEGSKARRGAMELVVAAAVAGVAAGTVGGAVLSGNALAVYVTLASGGGVLIGERWWDAFKFRRNFEAKLESRVAPDVEAAERLERTDLVSQIRRCLELEPSVLSQQYLVVSGLQKSGKTTAVKMACENRKGVVYVAVNPRTEFFSTKLATELGLDSTSRAAEIGRRIHAARKGKPPVVVVADVASKTPGSTVQNVGNEMKVLVENAEGAVGGVVVLSNSTSVFALTNGGRHEHIVVDGFTDPEAQEYVVVKCAALNDSNDPADRDLLQRIIEDDTTVVGTLQTYAQTYADATGDAAANRVAVEALFDNRAVEADASVKKLLTFGSGTVPGTSFDVPEYRKLVNRLLDAPNPEDGVFDTDLDLPAASDVAPVLQKHPALRYNPKTLRYYWYETRHGRAAERLKRAKPPLLRP